MRQKSPIASPVWTPRPCLLWTNGSSERPRPRWACCCSAPSSSACPSSCTSSRSWSAPGRCSAPRVNLFHAAYRAVVGPRLKPAEDTVPLSDVRALDLLAGGLLVVASLAFVVGIDLIGWFFVLVEAGIAAVAATTGVNAARALLEQLRGPT